MPIDDFQQATAPADAALARMKELDLPCTPNNYTVWYEYFSGADPDLCKAIDILLSNDQAITADRCKQLHKRFFSNQVTESTEIASRMEKAADKILTAVSGAGKNTAKYGKALQNLSGNLDGEVDANSLQVMIGEVLSETKTMFSQIKSLQSKVDESTREITDLREELELTRRDALTDGLTGIANRKWFEEMLKQSAARAMETGEPLCLIMADIDHFKKLNDAYGHQIGDHVLRLVAQTLRQGIKGRDTVARYGGEEFSLILPDTELAGATALAESLRKSVADKRLVKKGSDKNFGSITLSMGVTEFAPGEPIEECVHRADTLLYQAKKYGRNRVVAEAASLQQSASSG